MLPALPTGIASASIEPSSSATSSAAVFWPSSRNGLTEFTSAIGCRCTSSRTSLRASSKLPRSATTRAPCMRAWASLPIAIFPSGTITAPRSPARAAYAAALAAVFPVDAQMIASAPSPAARETASVIPRLERQPVPISLYEWDGHVISNELLLDDPDRPRRGTEDVQLGDPLERGVEVALGALVHDHHQAGVVAQPPLDDAANRDLVLPQHGSDLGEDAGAVGDLQMKVEGRVEVPGHLEALARRVDRRLPGDDRDDVPEHRRRGLGAPGPRAGHRDLGDRGRL